ncbi:MAG: 30S ribosomal protein S6e [Candidatus Thermoplasmatota archaeon]|jgi:small subunit ribosomal protein S6e|nr:30S ribosomal protein S6e [Candidatus Thermoplasmatota archaeon]MCL5988127.1 30S ribosomal protein S6e [Candidatus Thermoplasmatota archaeon]
MATGNSVAIIADRKSGKTYKREIKPENLSLLSGRRIGEEVDGIFFEMPGYKLQITGGTSIDGFAMKPDLFISGKKRILVRYREGERHKDGIRKRVTFRGAVIGPDIAQLNFVINQYGPDPLEKSEEPK